MKERIQQKARELFLRYGFRSVKMDDISKELGISKKTVYQYFSDKDGLVEAIMLSEMAQMQKNLSEEYLAKDAIDALFKNMLSFECQIDSLNPDILTDLEKCYPGTFQKFRQFKFDVLLEAVKTNLMRGVDEGLFRPEIDVDIISKFRLESAFCIFNPELFPYGKYGLMDVAKEIFMLFIHGIVTQKGRALLNQYMQKQLTQLEKSER